jgi:hypothetical protein
MFFIALLRSYAEISTMLQLCATLLNATWLATLKMNELLIKKSSLQVAMNNALRDTVRRLTYLKGATGQNVSECNLCNICPQG